MSEKNYWLSSGFFSMMHRGVDFIVGFVGFMILVRLFSPEEFGVWVLFITIAAIIDMARNGFLQNGMIKFIVSEKGMENSKIQISALQLNAALTLLIILFIWMAAPFAETLFGAKGLADLLQIHVFFLPFLIFHTHNLILMQATFNFKSYFFAGISKSVPFFVFIAIVYLLDYTPSLIELAWYYNLCFIFALLTSQYQVKNQFQILWGWHKEWLGKIFHFGKFVFGTNLVSMLTSSMDKFLLGALLSPVQVAMANSAGRIVNLLDIPINSISSISFPKASEAHEKKQMAEVSRIFEMTVAAMFSFSMAFLVVVVFLAKYIILLVAGENYLDAVPYLQLISLIAILKPLDRQTGIFLDAIGKPAYNMVLVFGTLAYGIALSWVFILQFGLIGAAMGVLVAISITVVIKIYILNKFLSISYGNILKETFFNYPKAFKIAVDQFQKIKNSRSNRSTK
ncbi:oligosaccharide flippase family protein [Rhodonellum sp.]|uniref:oligosaccharide flippase family protein n=1 Tax=Rhodonellum sp. TaxID=2231180 RepID=UPI002720AD27|nr:oligosaccharide flippase family protein [Rhodonellum sp.]MDO9553529.1 oligosaccharide flippase family protein [Rhodonellum sp.]